MIDKENFDLVKIIEGTNRNLNETILIDSYSITSLFYPRNHLVTRPFHPEEDFPNYLDDIL